MIRGVDHLTNAARQAQIYKAMGWDVPVFAHVPLIHGPDGAKLSKRHGALGIEAYRAMGYLPAGLRNYLARLGWSHGDDEIFSTAQAIQWFDIDDINKSPGRLDFAKLADVNSHYIRQASDEELIRHLQDLLPHLDNGAEIAARIERTGWDQVAAALPDPQGARQDAARPDRRRSLPHGPAPADPGRQGAKAARRRSPRYPCQVAAAAPGGARLERPSARGMRAPIRGNHGPEARAMLHSPCVPP